ncbi:SGNH/GDSL hydrolase family protein [Viridibacillus sp. YIM B01967]|uniref:SGNH/GDSL hydrolase family protein n=1 Tax=Viridibacillus soli TaxID=2798301 RepID=A0ABS1H7V5_9BACL|nr:SGNH/GDSL hydrolase family protein [Viridibacillus soli]MBK3495497.1 SGNH/GDSL hydrolase family protein [Viridibacillus soli]
MKIICFGDSITARKENHLKPVLTSMLKMKMKQHKFINAGVSGNTTEQAKERFHKDVLAKNPNLVTVLFGGNDSATHKLIPIDTFKSNIRYFVQQIGVDQTILITSPPVDELLQPNRNNQLLKEYGQAVKDVAAETGCHCIDFFEILYSKPNYKELLVGIKNDGLHFGEAGYDLLSDAIVEEVEKMEGVSKKGICQRILNIFR